MMTPSPIALSLGQIGSRYMSDTTTYNGRWGIVDCITDCTFTTLTSATRDDGVTKHTLGTLDGMSLVAGQRLYGDFSTIKLASGSVMAYENGR